MELPLKAKVALIRASIVDRAGNCIFNKTTSNFNPMMATAADLVIVEAEQVVEIGEIDPDRFTTAGYIHRLHCGLNREGGNQNGQKTIT